jgi:hypothetical protein
VRSVHSGNSARRRARIAALGGALAFALSAQPAGAAPTPIPEGAPIGSPPPTFIGAPAAQNPVFASRPPRHPFMAPNDRSELHNDAYQTDANVGPGPLGIGMQRLSTLHFADCGSITFDSRGRLVTICVGLVRPTLMMIDPNTLDTLASMPLPERDPSGGKIFNDFAAGGYFYLDNRDRAVLLTNSKHLLVVRETPGPGFAIDRDYDLTSAIKLGDKGFSALPDWSGRLWFVTSKAVVGTIDPATGKVRSVQLTDGDVENSFAVDETGGVYVVTNRALYRFDPGPSGEPKVTWREVYPNSGIQKPGQGDIGSGTTPTLMDHGLVAITDNADPMDIVVYKRARSVTGNRLVCTQPVFQKGASASDNSLIAAGRAMVVENNYGYSGPQATENGKTTTPGVWRVDVNRSLNGCSTIWKSNEISPTVVPKLSLANGLVYLYTKNPSADGSDDWYLTAVGFRTGRTIFKRLAGEGLGFNNNYAPITIGPDNGSVYVGTLGGMVMLRDAVPPPRPTSSSGKPRLTLSLSYRRRHRCAVGPEKAKVGGPDTQLLGEVDFSAGGRTWRVFHPPFARRFDLEGGERGHRYDVRALAKLVDGRQLSLRARLRVCPD